MESNQDHPWDKVIGFCIATEFERSVLCERNYLIDGMKWEDQKDWRRYFRCGKVKLTDIRIDFVSFNDYWICFISLISIRSDISDVLDFVIEYRRKSKYSPVDCNAIQFDRIVGKIIQEKNKS